jgi:hypothetical protein
MRRALLLATGLFACTREPSAPLVEPAVAAGARHTHPLAHSNGVVRPPLEAEQADRLRSWYRYVGERQAREGFGDLVVRAGRYQLNKPYDTTRQQSISERLHIDLAKFQCVSFVESTLALARCVWRDTPDETCFTREVQAFRYRNGTLDGYPSRLHYFPDWLEDNARRRRMAKVTADLGGRPIRHSFTFMTAHSRLYPALADREVRAAIRAHEQRLSDQELVILERDGVGVAQDRLQNGDIVAVVSTRKPGLLIGHTGFVDTRDTGAARLLHASSHHRRVLLTSQDIVDYLQRRPYRRGIMVGRPLAPMP